MAKNAETEVKVIKYDEGQLPPRHLRPYSWVTFSKGDANGDKSVVAWLNGARFEYPRGEKCLVPDAVLNGPIRDAIVVNVDETDAKRGRVLTEELAYPYQVYGSATPEEVAEYFGKIDQAKLAA